MAHRVCPWWLGYFLASPIRRLFENPAEIVAPYVREGMTVLEPGPGMGFFTLEVARRVGPRGRVIAVDVQPRMLAGLNRRAATAGLLSRIDARLAGPDSLGIADVSQVDFVLAFAVVHELPAPESFFVEVARPLKSGGTLLLAEPTGHVKPALFEQENQFAARAGLAETAHPSIRRCHAALFTKR
jgi:ubiquinone/menaquinone biosynthesis C-methylase UbiE